MTEKKITRKVISSFSKDKTETKKVEDVANVVEYGRSKEVKTKRYCSFCQNKTSPSYTDVASLRRLLTDRAKIVAKERSGVCSRHQRAVAKNIKYARNLALLPFVPKV